MPTQTSFIRDLLTETNAPAIMQQSLKEAGVDIDVSDPEYQLVVTPATILYSVMAKKISDMQNAFTLAADGLAEDISYDEDVLRAITANLTIAPVAGTNTTGVIDVVFSDNGVRSIPASTQFITPEGQVFYPAHKYTLVPTAAARASNTVEFQMYTKDYDGTYHAVIDVVSEGVGDIAVPAAAGFTTSVPGALSASATNAFDAGSSAETLRDVMLTLPSSLSERSLSSPVGLTSSILDQFPGTQIRVFRSGESEVLRDRRNLFGVETSAADVYAKTALNPQCIRKVIDAGIVFSVDDFGNFYNGSQSIGSVDDILLPEPKEYVVSGEITDRDLRGAYHVTHAELQTPSTPKTATSTAATHPGPGIRVVGREVAMPGVYGRTAPKGNEYQDFAFSAYQAILKFEFDLEPRLITKDNDLFLVKLTAFFGYWTEYHKYNADPVANPHSPTLMGQFSQQFAEGASEVPNRFYTGVSAAADVVYMPKLADIQAWINDDSRRAWVQDYVVRAPVIAPVELTVTLPRTLSTVRFKENYFKSKIMAYVNKGGMAGRGISTTYVKSLVFDELPADTDDSATDVLGRAVLLLPNDTSKVISGEGLTLPTLEEHGVTPRNTLLFTVIENIKFIYV